MTLDPANWLNIMPTIPLARGVTITHRSGDRSLDRVCLEEQPDRNNWRCDVGGSTPNYRVDLEDPQGFAYALRQWWLKRGTDATERLRNFYNKRMVALTEARQRALKTTASVQWSRWEPLGHLLLKLERGMFAVTLRWLRGQTTDADRLALAQALAEVTP
uniref:Uncharacterized protein n=1 Tax=uncultured marine virus TaxID=186617 RepID=A0A0F7L6I2_9VIRU|nr:hypothetical protein [uncultured marine virus]